VLHLLLIAQLAATDCIELRARFDRVRDIVADVKSTATEVETLFGNPGRVETISREFRILYYSAPGCACELTVDATGAVYHKYFATDVDPAAPAVKPRGTRPPAALPPSSTEPARAATTPVSPAGSAQPVRCKSRLPGDVPCPRLALAGSAYCRLHSSAAGARSTGGAAPAR
jgi:hypothetical protein